MAGLKGKSGPPGNMNAFKHRLSAICIERAIHTNGHAAITVIATRDSLPLAEYLDGERNCGQRTNANQRPPNCLALLGTKLVGKQERDARPKKSTCYGDESDFR
jgi:hypothetical protein